MAAFIGFTKPGEEYPNIKTSPRWCPLRENSCGNGTLVSVHGYSGEEVVEKWNKIMPAADVEEVRHGRWIKTDPGNDTLFATCSQCNYPVDWWRGKTKYCPNCGARMDGDE